MGSFPPATHTHTHIGEQSMISSDHCYSGHIYLYAVVVLHTAKIHYRFVRMRASNLLLQS